MIKCIVHNVVYIVCCTAVGVLVALTPIVGVYRLGWIPATAVIVTLTVATIYSGLLLLRLYQHVPNAVLFGDIGEAAAGRMVWPASTKEKFVETEKNTVYCACG